MQNNKQKLNDSNQNQGNRRIKFEKPKDFKGTMKKLAIYLKPYYFRIALSGILAIIAALLTVFAPYMLGLIITEITKLHDGRELTGIVLFKGFVLSLNKGFILLVVIYLTATLLNYLQGFLLIATTQNLTYQLRKDLAHKINHLPLAFFDKYQYGDILSRSTNDVETINSTLTQSISEIFRSITLVVSILVIMFVIQWQMAIIVTLGVIVSLVVASQFVRVSQKFFKRQAKSNGELSGHVEETYSGHTIVKLFNHQEQSKKTFDRVNDELFDSSWKSQFISGIMFPIQMFLGNLAYIGVVIFGAFLILNGSLEVGFMMTYIQYTRQVNQPIQQIGSTASVFQQIAAAAERVFLLLDAPSEPEETNKQTEIPQFKGNVEFKNVSFGYLENQEIIKGFNANIKAGQTVAIVGPTGAGKTTIVNLLMRFYEINKGEILIDGVNINKLKRETVRSLFGMVLQDTWLFEGTILENIKYGSIDKTQDEVIEASKAAQINHFIKSLPDSYHFVLNEDGTNISQGQRQLITIARAMLSNKPMLILDEATSSVDTRTEKLIQSAMDNLMKNRTSFVIAHRLSTIKNADLILVMKDGNIIELGTHQELLEKKGFYETLYNSQFENN
ncbi:ABC-type transport system, permease and ATPase components [Alteracholeplasma palmae J233]|uniref:ABC-type transport system, permease and ATPase components n=1 Tax=Alteracholeplasma palmae (strain ATCC 49389 / J233) TaxID=1318466 RepID=U4KPJ4_ALTPJ|nr:ABC transporter ATP-binding protein [Alteracholeplasma palmae]CCV64170.1 ABC-type transport system, permease and ATPase components [Alteracholeplasma palmae J233]